MKAVNRGRLAKQLYEQHGSLTEVGKILGVSVDRVRQLIESADRHTMRPSWLEGLDERLANILIRIYGVRLWAFPSNRGLFRHRGKYVKRIVNKRSWYVKVWKFINPPSC